MLNERNLDDLIDVRMLIEVECARRAAKRRTQDTINQINAAIEKMKAHSESADQFMAIDMEFHDALSEASNNPILDSIGSTIQSMVRIWYPKTYYIPETKDQTLSEHLKIAEAVENQDENAAGEAMRKHLVEAARRLRRALATP
jgi:GntR family transcriptional repressor for pyruvate dehydrogenase complex